MGKYNVGSSGEITTPEDGGNEFGYIRSARKGTTMSTPSNKIGGVMLMALVIVVLWYVLKGGK